MACAVLLRQLGGHFVQRRVDLDATRLLGLLQSVNVGAQGRFQPRG